MIKHLPKEKFKHYPINFSYETNGYYDVEIYDINHTMGFELIYKLFENTVKKSFVDRLYEDYNDNAEAYGYYVEDELAGLIELNFDTWNKRLRITEVIVFADYKRQKIGTKLMSFAKTKAAEYGARMMVLETQTCNIPAIRFYQANGFQLVGVDTSCYSNDDVAAKEVRIELGYYR